MAIGNLATMAQLDKLTLAIGEDNFGEVLLAAAKALSDVDHVMIYAFPPRATPRTVVSVGAIDPDLACELGLRYCVELYLLDPNYPQIRKQPGQDRTSWFEYEGGHSACEVYRDAFQRCQVSDMLSFAVAQDDVVYYVMFLRTAGRAFVTAQGWLLNLVGDVIAANVRKHFSYMHALKGRNQFMLGRILSESRLFKTATQRERAVCVGILTGYTSESIGLNLGISINSVLTYRKRLYEKLNISSQNELFARVIDAMIELGEMKSPVDPAEKMLNPFLDCMAEPSRSRSPAADGAPKRELVDNFLDA